jgi:hypothetical protein
MSSNNDKKRRANPAQQGEGKEASAGQPPSEDPHTDPTFQPESGVPRSEPTTGDRSIDDE